MKITSIKQQAKNPERVSIFVDDKYSFSLTLDELVRERLKNGDELDGSRLKKLKKLSVDGKLRMRALAWVMNRPHSVREFHDYMYRKKADESLTNQLQQEFVTKGYLDELGFARWLVEMRQRTGKSNRQIKAELFKKGIDRETVERVLESDADDEMARLRAVITKKMQLPRYANDPQRLTEYLLRQGYGWQLIKEALALNQPED